MGTVHGLLTIVLLAQVSAALPPDSVDALRDRARRAEAAFERLSRQLAPFTFTWSGGADCDEIVGRFCLRFDSTTAQPAGEEAGRIVDARREAVEAARRFFAAAPADRRAAGPLVRLLVGDGRPREASSAAGAYAALSGDTLWAHFLLGMARHAAGSDSLAERHFIEALGRLPTEERRAWLDPRWLLDPDERRRVRRMDPSARAEYERRFWLLSDPFWLTPANERWNGHMARHVQARLLAEVPVVGGAVSWGADLDELTIRYGTPVSRARMGAMASPRDGMVEYYDSAQRAFDHPRLREGIPGPPDPGERPLLYSARARSAYAVPNAARVLEPAHQVTRFMRSDSVFLRVDAALQVDTPYVRARTGLFAYDSAFTRRSHVTGTAAVTDDTARFVLVVPAPGGRVIYSVEILGDSGAIAGRARYALDANVPGDGPVLSDLLIARRFDATSIPERFDDRRIRGIESLIVRPGDTIGIYAEIYRLAEGSTADIAVMMRDADGPSLLGRLARWMGRSLGLIGPAGGDPRVGWQVVTTGGRAVIALNLPLDPERAGMQELVVRVTDTATGGQTETFRRLLIRR